MKKTTKFFNLCDELLDLAAGSRLERMKITFAAAGSLHGRGWALHGNRKLQRLCAKSVFLSKLRSTTGSEDVPEPKILLREILLGFCWDSAGILPGICWDSARILLGFCWLGFC